LVVPTKRRRVDAAPLSALNHCNINIYKQYFAHARRFD
jgi:hypothetical protein